MRPSVYVIAEAGVNHNGRLDLAMTMVDAAAAAGADAVKFQAFRTCALVSAGAPLADYQKAGVDAVDQAAMLGSLELGEEDFKLLAARARRRGIAFLCSVFDEVSATRIAPLVTQYKIPSGELTNHPLLVHVARTGKPMIVSTGMSTLDEIRAALAAIRATGDVPVTLLQCTSLYPTPPEAANLAAIDTLRHAFRLPVGYSDHAVGNALAFAAVGMGAVMIEKHFTLDRSMPGPDHAASVTPEELTALVAGIRDIERARGTGEKQPSAAELAIARVVRRSVVVTRDIAAGEVIDASALATARPASGIPPKELANLVGRRASRFLAAGTALQWTDV